MCSRQKSEESAIVLPVNITGQDQLILVVINKHGTNIND